MEKWKVKRHFQFQTWHAMWSSGLHIFLLLTSGSSRCLVIERIFSNHHDLHYKYDKEWKKRKIKMHLKFQTWHAMWSSGSSYLPSLTSRNGKMKGQKAFLISNVTWYMKCRAPYLPSFDFRVLQLSCIWKNTLKLSWP